jgi:hypothetical protein
MNRYVIAVIAVVLVVMVVWRPPQLKAGLHYLAPLALDGQEPTKPTPTPGAERQDPAKCLDGSPLTVTSRDSNQTNYRCESGAIGAYTN